jgi:hypothetical protein
MEGKSGTEHSWVSFSHIIHQVRASLWSSGSGSPCSDSLSQLVSIRNAGRSSKERGYGWEGKPKKVARMMVNRDPSLIPSTGRNHSLCSPGLQ